MHAPPTARDTSVLQRCAGALLRLIGWRSVIVYPPAAKGIIIVYPHTSNWDFVIGVLYRASVALPVRWLGKHTLFRWPVQSLLRRMGGIPVRRDRPAGVVDDLLAQFAGCDWLWLALTPEGTRSRTDHWKSGFYRLALAARLPLGLGYIDYASRTIGIDFYLQLSGDADHDLARIRAFYADKSGYRPERAGPIRFRD